MRGKVLRMVAIVAVIFCILFTVAACGGSSQNTPDKQQSETTEKVTPAPTAESEPVTEITVWSSMNNGEGFYRNTAKEDIVGDELAKKTGVKVADMITSGGMKAIEKFNLLYASDSVPDVITGWQNSGDFNIYEIIQMMKKADMLWGWTDDEIKALAPNAYKMVSPIAYQLAKDVHQTGDKNVVLLHKSHGLYSVAAETYPEWVQKNYYVKSDAAMLRFRDDILKEFIPTAKTVAELEEIFKAKGRLDYEDVVIPELDTFDELKAYLYKVKEKYGSKGIVPLGHKDDVVHTFERMVTGGWFFAGYNPIKNDITINVWDNQNQFTSVMKDLNKMLNDGILTPDFATIKDDMFKEKINTGKFAVVGDGSIDEPNGVLKSAGSPFLYRHVFFTYDNSEKIFDGYGKAEPARCGYAFIFNKKTLDENKVKKVLGYYDYLATPEGQKLIAWGPESAGLWEEKDGKRVWKDKDFEAVIKGEKPVGEIKDFAYYGLEPGGVGGSDKKFHHDYYFIPFNGTTPAYSTVENSTFSIERESWLASNRILKGFYDDNYAAFNGTTKSNTEIWSHWGEIKGALSKIVMMKPNQFDKGMESWWTFYKDVCKVEEYYKEQKTYMDWIKPFKDSYNFHPKADMSKVN